MSTIDNVLNAMAIRLNLTIRGRDKQNGNGIKYLVLINNFIF